MNRDLKIKILGALSVIACSARIDCYSKLALPLKKTGGMYTPAYLVKYTLGAHILPRQYLAKTRS